MSNLNNSLLPGNVSGLVEYRGEENLLPTIQEIEDMRSKLQKSINEILGNLNDLSEKYKKATDPEVKKGIARMFDFYKKQLDQKKGLFGEYNDEQRRLGMFGGRRSTRKTRKHRRTSRK